MNPIRQPRQGLTRTQGHVSNTSERQPFVLTSVVMLAFAANSLLCRQAITSNSISVTEFTCVRLVSGAITLWLLVAMRSGRCSIGGNWFSAAALFGYAACFSLAYTALSAGTGALLLFGAVQISMISWGLMQGERFTPLKWLGVVSAFCGLAWLVAPGIEAPPLSGAVLMVTAGICWGVYSLRGRRATDPTWETAGNFVRSAPFAIALYALPGEHAASASSIGWTLAIASGAVTSGLGYALWYAVLPQLSAGTSATVQLSVPIIAAAGGVLILGEPFSIRLAIASAVVVGGIFVFIHSGRRA